MREPSALVVDDEDLVGQLICDALQEAGYDVVSTASGPDALRLLAGERKEWAGVVTDINLGPASPRGWDVARSARRATPAIAVIYVSGDSSDEWAVQGVPLSVMISKPFTVSRVVVALADLLNARQGGL